jgi:hypothetical protein
LLGPKRHAPVPDRHNNSREHSSVALGDPMGRAAAHPADSITPLT